MMTECHTNWADALAHEHLHLGDILSRVRRLLEAPVDVTRDRRLVILLELLTIEVREHREFEEEGGYLAPVMDLLPQRQNAVAQLQREHALLQAGLADALACLRTCVNGADFRDRIAPRLDQWLDRLHDHEQRENLLVQEAFNTDISAGD